MAVEKNNVPSIVPSECCWRQVETYMIGGQYDRDLDMIKEQILEYASQIVVADDGMDAWILDVDDTCISNILFYKGKRYGGFVAWAMKGGCPAIPAVLELFKKLIQGGFKVILLTGRDEETFLQATTDNLHTQGFIGYERLILRTADFKGQNAITYKSAVRKKLVDEGFRIWGNVGDQLSDLQGEYNGNRTFKLPNPLYFIP